MGRSNSSMLFACAKEVVVRVVERLGLRKGWEGVARK